MLHSSGRSLEACSAHNSGFPQALLGKQIHVELLEELEGMINSVILVGNPSSVFAPFPCEIRGSKHGLECFCENTFIFGSDEEASLAIAHELWIAPNLRGNDGASSGHRFEDCIR